MSDIEWTDRTWNPIVGCTRVSPGCTHCYAERQVHRKLSKQHVGLTVLRKSGVGWTGEVRLVESALAKPLHWRKPQRVFVNSLSDLWHENVSNETVAAIFGVMAACPHLTFQVLTKRPERMQAWFAFMGTKRPETIVDAEIRSCALAAGRIFKETTPRVLHDVMRIGGPWPLPNVWLGVTAEDQQRADERIHELLDTPAAKRFVSYEPALEAVDFHAFLKTPERDECLRILGRGAEPLPGIDWLIVGGESGPKARPFDLAWARSAVEQCKAAGVACFVKQLGAQPIAPVSDPEASNYGERLPLKLKHRKGADMDEWWEYLRVREFPT